MKIHSYWLAVIVGLAVLFLAAGSLVLAPMAPFVAVGAAGCVLMKYGNRYVTVPTFLDKGEDDDEPTV